MGFYEQIATEYDDVTGQAARTQPVCRFLAELGRRHRLGRVLDAACGTGLHAVLLAQGGAAVTGADISDSMLDQARRRADAAGVDIRWLPAPMQELAARVASPFDAVLCLGNSLPHLLQPAELDATLAGFASLLAPGGVVVLQLLNYSRILARGERVVGVTRSAGREYVRFYDFLGDLVQFNVLTLAWTEGRCETDIVSTPLRPYRPGEIMDSLRRGGLGHIELFGGLDFRPFDEAESDVLLVIVCPA
jgi:SAM-dependent methyltransferase